MNQRRRQLPVIGWREWVSLPDLGVDEIKAKIDTGARTSSLHAFGVERFDRNGTAWVRFVIHPIQRDSSISIPAESRLVDERLVRNPGGREEVRPVIRTALTLAGKRWFTEITLTRRDTMGFRMLLGRQSVRGRFVIDPGSSFKAERRKQ